jgi:hypothetical protein
MNTFLWILAFIPLIILGGLLLCLWFLWIPGLIVAIIILVPLGILFALISIVGIHGWKPLKFVLFVVVPIYLILLLISSYVKIDPMAKIKEDKNKTFTNLKDTQKLQYNPVYNSADYTISTSATGDETLTFTETSNEGFTNYIEHFDPATTQVLKKLNIKKGDRFEQEDTDGNVVATGIIKEVLENTNTNAYTFTVATGTIVNTGNGKITIYRKEEEINIGSAGSKRSLGNVSQYNILPIGELCGIGNNYKPLTEKECKKISSKRVFTNSNVPYIFEHNPSFRKVIESRNNVHGCSMKTNDPNEALEVVSVRRNNEEDQEETEENKNHGDLFYNTSKDTYTKYNQKSHSLNNFYANICKKDDLAMESNVTTTYYDITGCDTSGPLAAQVTCENDYAKSAASTTTAASLLTLDDYAILFGIEGDSTVREGVLLTYTKNDIIESLRSVDRYSLVNVKRLELLINQQNNAAYGT